jgi:ABC-type lipoprotein release transport system permease subunit
MRKLKILLITSLVLGIISMFMMVLDFIFLENLANGSGNFYVEWHFLNYSFIVFVIFFLSIFATIYQALRFLNNKISRVY